MQVVSLPQQRVVVVERVPPMAAEQVRPVVLEGLEAVALEVQAAVERVAGTVSRMGLVLEVEAPVLPVSLPQAGPHPGPVRAEAQVVASAPSMPLIMAAREAFLRFLPARIQQVLRVEHPVHPQEEV